MTDLEKTLSVTLFLVTAAFGLSQMTIETQQESIETQQESIDLLEPLAFPEGP